MSERIVWLPFGTIRVLLNGVEADVRMGEPPQKTTRLDSWALRRRWDPVVRRREAALSPRLSTTDRAILRLADTKLVRHHYRNAWVLMDRVHNANDSAEHLFRWLRKHRRKTNAWFVIQSGTPDADRLRKDGLRRVVSHGSLRWKLLMLNAQHLISTHIDAEIVAPTQTRALREGRWRFTFLQHGVIKDDVSRWLNTKDLELFVASTAAEYNSIVADGARTSSPTAR